MMAKTLYGQENEVLEWNYISSKARIDPFNEIQLDIHITDKEGKSWVIPAFWGGGQEWRVRFSAPEAGIFKVVSKCTDPTDYRLHGIKMILTVTPSKNTKIPRNHHALQVNSSKKHFEFTDGKPFFWLADTWWMGLSDRLSWPEDFQRLTADRVKKGFTVIQIVAGLLPDMGDFDERAENEAGFPWEKDYETINPAYFDMADLRINWLIKSGLTPCILGAWGYYLLSMDVNKMKQHWRYIIARWGAYPVIWSLAGEAAMPYYLSSDREKDTQILKDGWSEIGKYIKHTDPYARLLTVHPSHIGRDQVSDHSFMDFDMLQTGHSAYESVKNTIKTLGTEVPREPAMPVVVAEVNYEGIFHSNHADIQRLTFWSAFLSGASGFSYGANGVWQVNQKNNPFGKSPHGGNWGETPWDEAYQYDGSTHLGLAAKLLQEYEWWEFSFHPEWVSLSGNSDNITAPFAGGIARKVRIIYSFGPLFPWEGNPFKIQHIESDVNYEAFFWNPRNGEKQSIGLVEADETGSWETPTQPTFKDWVIILEAS